MPRGPKGEKRPGDVIGAAVMVAKIATGEVEDTNIEKNPHAAAIGRLGGAKGGKARAAKLSADDRKRIGRKAGLDHFGIEAEDLARVRAKLAKKYPDIEIVKRPDNRAFASYSARDPAGNYFDLSREGAARLALLKKCPHGGVALADPDGRLIGQEH
jgi:hypothetical protein